MRFLASPIVATLAVLLAAGCRSATEPGPLPTGGSAVAVGGYHACALQQGTVYCWGANFSGQLGSGTFQDSPIPVAVVTPLEFSSISAQAHGTCGISDGTIHCWGRAPEGSGAAASPLPVEIAVPGVTFAAVSVGGYHACGLATDGRAFCWGANTYGELGSGAAGASTAPLQVAGGLRFADISAGSLHTCGITDEGVAYCWGSNEEGQLGIGSHVPSSVPVAVDGNRRFASITSGNRHTCGVDAQGSMYCWGQNQYGQLGDGTTNLRTIPVAVAGGHRFAFGTGRGGYQSCGILVGGQAYCWGGNEAGQVGDGSVADRLTPQQVVGGHRFRSLDISAEETCGVTLNDEVYCWGENDDGELGVGSTTNSTVPVRVLLPDPTT